MERSAERRWLSLEKIVEEKSWKERKERKKEKIGKLTSENIFDYCFGLSLFTNADSKYCKQEIVTFYFANNFEPTTEFFNVVT